GLVGSFVLSVTCSAIGPGGADGFSTTSTRYSAPPRNGPPRLASVRCTSSGPDGDTTSVSFQSRVLPEYFTITDCVGAFTPCATVPNATAPGTTLTSVRLFACNRITAVETNFGPKVT